MIGFFNRPNLARSLYDQTGKKVKAGIINDISPAVQLIKRISSIEGSSITARWKLTPLVYDAYISGLLYATAVRYAGPGSDVIQQNLLTLNVLLKSSKSNPNFSLLKYLKNDVSNAIIDLYQYISIDYLKATGLNLSSNLFEMSSWITNHSFYFNDATISVSDEITAGPSVKVMNNKRTSFIAHRSSIEADGALVKSEVSVMPTGVPGPFSMTAQRGDGDLTLFFVAPYNNVES